MYEGLAHSVAVTWTLPATAVNSAGITTD